MTGCDCTRSQWEGARLVQVVTFSSSKMASLMLERLPAYVSLPCPRYQGSLVGGGETSIQSLNTWAIHSPLRSRRCVGRTTQTGYTNIDYLQALNLVYSNTSPSYQSGPKLCTLVSMALPGKLRRKVYRNQLM
jgi:hypothetical protein